VFLKILRPSYKPFFTLLKSFHALKSCLYYRSLPLLTFVLGTLVGFFRIGFKILSRHFRIYLKGLFSICRVLCPSRETFCCFSLTRIFSLSLSDYQRLKPLCPLINPWRFTFDSSFVKILPYKIQQSFLLIFLSKGPYFITCSEKRTIFPASNYKNSHKWPSI